MRPEIIIVICALVLAGCDGDGTRGGKKTTAGEGGSDGTTTATPGVARSDKALVRFKRDLRLRNDFAQALGLDGDSLCAELGQYDCIGEVHGVALGGLRPYDLGINEHPRETGVTAPLVVERVALAACGERVQRDLDGEGLIYQLTIADGALTDAHAPEISAAITTLYRRALQRDPKASELVHHTSFYDAVETESETPARDWAVLTCFAVLTSTESLFY